MSEPALPPGWVVAPLEAIAADVPHAMTDGPFGSNLKSDHYTDSGPRVMRLQNIGEGVFVDAHAHISGDYFARLRKHSIEAGDLIVAILGERLPRACILPPDIGPAIVKADCIRVAINRRLAEPKYVNWWLNSSRVQRQVTANLKGVGRPRMNLSQLRSLSVAVPPLAEQRRIVAKIEELFSNLDAGVAAMERVKTNLKRYRAAVLKAAVEGRLTKEWRRRHPDTEPAAILLARILAERRAKWEQDQLRKFKESGKTPPKGWKDRYETAEVAVGISSDIPGGWVRTTIDQVSSLDVGFAFKSDQFTNDGVRLLRGENIEPGALRWKETRCWPTEQIAGFEHLMVREGDIILAMDRPIVSAGLKVCRAKAHDLPCLLVQRVARFRPINTKFTAFLYLAVQTRDFIRHVLAGQTGTQLPHISGQGIASFSFSLPPLAEQAEIVAEVDRRLSVADAAEQQVEHALQRAARLRQAILKRAFEGNLVLQDPSDEPAAALLERIKSPSNGKRPAPAKPPKRIRAASGEV